MKAETKFTPGPWETIKMNDDRYFPSVLLGNPKTYSDHSGVGRHEIHINEGQPPNELYWSNTMEAARANASLIAAAPDLYQALEAAVSHMTAEYLQMGGDEEAKTNHSMVAFGKIIDRGNAILQKARGE